MQEKQKIIQNTDFGPWMNACKALNHGYIFMALQIKAEFLHITSAVLKYYNFHISSFTTVRTGGSAAEIHVSLMVFSCTGLLRTTGRYFS